MCGEECLIIGLAVKFPKTECKCHLSAIVCIRHAACRQLPGKGKFKVQSAVAL
jgi:hypothetical protein